MTDYTAAVTAIDELQRRSFRTPPTKEEWKAHAWERDLNIEMLNDGDIEDMEGWVLTSETPKDFINNNWVLRDQEDDALRLERADGTDIYIAPVGDEFITYLDHA